HGTGSSPRPPRELSELLNAPMQMSMKGLWDLLIGRKTVDTERPTEAPGQPEALPEVMGYFQSYYDAEEVFALGTVREGEQRTIGRSLATREDVFPGYYRNISRSHLELRLREGRLELKPAPGSLGIRINGIRLMPI